MAQSDRVLPAELTETREVAVTRYESHRARDRQRGQVRVSDEIARCSHVSGPILAAPANDRRSRTPVECSDVPSQVDAI